MRQKVVLFTLLVAATCFPLLTGCGSGTRVSSLGTISPARVTSGSCDFTLMLTGTNFTKTTQVFFGTLSLIPSSITTSQLVATVPASAVAKAGVLNVTISSGLPTSALTFTVENPAPVLTALSQESILLNSTSVSVEMTGSNFVSTSTVQFGGKVLTPATVTPTKLTVALPDSELTIAKTLSGAVTNPSPGGGTSSATSFSVLNPVPVISALSLDNTLVDSADFTLSLAGSGFAPGMTVRFGAVTLTPTEIAPTQVLSSIEIGELIPVLLELMGGRILSIGIDLHGMDGRSTAARRAMWIVTERRNRQACGRCACAEAQQWALRRVEMRGCATTIEKSGLLRTGSGGKCATKWA